MGPDEKPKRMGKGEDSGECLFSNAEFFVL